MKIAGEMLIGAASYRGAGAPVYGVDPTTGVEIDPGFGAGGDMEVSRAADLAWEAFDVFRETSPEQRALFLEAIASGIVDLADDLIERACQETGLPRGRIEGERARTVDQLRLFAGVAREGSFLEPRIDLALPDRKPVPRSDLRLRHVPLGPVAVFGASNFPLAFSVAGGDSASALAAGCPIIVKAHMAHPGASELVGRVVQKAVAACGLPEGVFSLLFSRGNELGAALVAHEHVKAVGFTGSRSGGLALMKIAAARPEPIPVYAEMSSVNPVFLLPGALKARAASIARSFAASLTLGAGQFCTNPGLVLARADDPNLSGFLDAAKVAIAAAPATTMLTSDIHAAYESGVTRLDGRSDVVALARGQAGARVNQARAELFATDGARFLADPELGREVFGPASLLVLCKHLAEMRDIAERLEGQLTATLQLEESDAPAARMLLRTLERKVGRILVNGFPTGVEVSHAMVHGGPYPSTGDGRSTSVGTLAIRRFLRPVCYQDMPQILLPEILRDGNPQGVWRLVDGTLGRR